MKKKQLLALFLAFATVFASVPVQALTVSENGVSENIVLTEEQLENTETFFSENKALSEQALTDGADSEYTPEFLGTFPEKYDPRDTGAVTSVRSQKDGTCYIFGVYGAMESNLIKRGLADNTIDLAELQAPYFMTHQVIDPLGNYTDDVEDSATEFYNQLHGGLPAETVDFLSLHGPIYETEMPYTQYLMQDKKYLDYTADRSLGSKKLFHLKSSKYIARHKLSDSKINEIKAFITEYGGVSATYCNVSTAAKATTTLGDYNYYNPNATTVNHVIEIVGWDDNYSKQNFKYTPSQDGAWLIKNSYGNVTVNYLKTSGYMWLSYDQTLDHIIALDFESADKYQNMYAYDGSSSPFDRTNDTDLVTINIYKAKAYGNKEVEKVDAVMTKLGSNVNYECTVYVNPIIQNGRLVSYTGKSNTVKGVSDYWGYYTLTFDEPAYVTEGNTFGICMKVDKKFGLNAGIDKQEKGLCYTGPSLNNLSDTYGRDSYNNNPKDGEGVSPTLRGLTNKAENVTLATGLYVTNPNISLNVGQSETISYQITPSFTTHATCGYLSSNENVAVVSETGVVTAKGAGTCNITVTTYDGECAKNVTVTVKETAKPPVTPVVVTPSSFTVKDITYKTSGNNLTVTEIDKKGTVKIPATVVYNGKSYTVTEIASNAAKESEMTKLIIPSTVKSIGNKAFYKCEALKNVTIGSGVEKIGSSAFYGCEKLKKVTVSTKVLKKVGTKAFKGIAQKATIKVPSSKKKAYKKLFTKKTNADTVIK